MGPVVYFVMQQLSHTADWITDLPRPQAAATAAMQAAQSKQHQG